jgi:large subunit ribosomal protein L15
MKYNQLEVTKMKTPRRKGRGISSGRGKTAGRGTKGQNSRAGGRRRPGFEGGQTPLAQRIPKLRGITKGGRTVADKLRHNARRDQVTTQQINELNEKIIDNQLLFKKGFVDNPYTSVKVIFKGELKRAHNINLQSASKNAVNAIEKAGGVFLKSPRLMRQSANNK